MSGCNTEVAPTGNNVSTPAGLTAGQESQRASNCKANNKDVQEFTAGYWYNIYAGPKGRLRYGLQYSLIRRDLWSGLGSATAPSVPNGLCESRWRSPWRRQHGLHLLPLLPPITPANLGFRNRRKGSPHGLPFLLFRGN